MDGRINRKLKEFRILKIYGLYLEAYARCRHFDVRH